jgi:hypothetical protein
MYGSVLPILISVSLAPGSYFFCAHAARGSNKAAPPKPIVAKSRRRV